MLCYGYIISEENTSAGTSDVTSTGATPDEIREIVEEALEDYEVRQASVVEDVSAQRAAELAALQDGLDAKLAENKDLIVKLGKDVEKVTTGTVSISADQWSVMQECWGWAKGLGSVALFLALVGTLLMAAMFGSKLWDHFTKGWRR